MGLIMRNMIWRATALAMCSFMGLALFAAPMASAQDEEAAAIIVVDGDCFVNVTTSEFEVVEGSEVLRGVAQVGEYESRETLTLVPLNSVVEVFEDELVPVECSPPLTDAVPDEVLGLAITGSNVNMPVAVGATLIGVGGILVAAGRKRRNEAPEA